MDETPGVERQAELKRLQWEYRLQKMKDADADKQSRQKRIARFKKISKNPVTIVIALGALLVGWSGVNSYKEAADVAIAEAAQNAMDNEQKAMEKEQQQQKVANKVAGQLRGCLNASEFTVDFDGLGVPLLTDDLAKVACASAALLGSSELPVELVNFAQSEGFAEVELFDVGNGKIQVTVGYGDVAFKIVFDR